MIFSVTNSQHVKRRRFGRLRETKVHNTVIKPSVSLGKRIEIINDFLSSCEDVEGGCMQVSMCVGESGVNWRDNTCSDFPVGISVVRISSSGNLCMYCLVEGCEGGLFGQYAGETRICKCMLVNEGIRQLYFAPNQIVINCITSVI